MAIHKNRLIPFKDSVSGKIVSKSGSSVLSKGSGEVICEFEYSSKSLDNLICAI